MHDVSGAPPPNHASHLWDDMLPQQASGFQPSDVAQSSFCDAGLSLGGFTWQTPPIPEPNIFRRHTDSIWQNSDSYGADRVRGLGSKMVFSKLSRYPFSFSQSIRCLKPGRIALTLAQNLFE